MIFTWTQKVVLIQVRLQWFDFNLSCNLKKFDTWEIHLFAILFNTYIYLYTKYEVESRRGLKTRSTGMSKHMGWCAGWLLGTGVSYTLFLIKHYEMAVVHKQKHTYRASGSWSKQGQMKKRLAHSVQTLSTDLIGNRKRTWILSIQ